MSFKEVLKITMNLVVLYIAGGILLAAVYAKTSPVIFKKNEQEKKEALQKLMPEADVIGATYMKTEKSLEKLREKGIPEDILKKLENMENIKFIGDESFLKTVKTTIGEEQTNMYKSLILKYFKISDWYPHEKHAEYFIAKKDENIIGYIVQSFGKGYSSYINILFSVDKKFIINKIDVLHHAETPGLGDEIELDYFKNQFIGKDEDHLKVLKTETTEYIQAITGATISTRAVSEDGIREGLKFLKKTLKEGAKHEPTATTKD